MPSNMKCCVSEVVAEQLSRSNYFYVMHRFGIDLYEFVHTANSNDWPFISISIGVSDDDFDVIKKLYSEGYRIDCVTVDIAHGHCKAMKELLPKLKTLFSETMIIAGNVATPDGVEDLADWGASAVKVGIGGGSVCSSKLKTGFTYPMFSCIKECAQNCFNTPLIADGGITHNGDIAKALGGGAHMVMIGGMLAGHDESEQQVVNDKIEFYGMSSDRALEIHGKRKDGYRANEGKLISLPYRGPVVNTLEDILGGVRSACTYIGARRLKDMPKCASFVTTNNVINRTYDQYTK